MRVLSRCHRTLGQDGFRACGSLLQSGRPEGDGLRSLGRDKAEHEHMAIAACSGTRNTTNHAFLSYTLPDIPQWNSGGFGRTAEIVWRFQWYTSSQQRLWNPGGLPTRFLVNAHMTSART